MTAILFLCHGNICRSPMAEYVMRYRLEQTGLDVQVESAALHRDELGSDVHPGTHDVLVSHGIPCPHRAARLATRDDYKRFDYLIGMDHMNACDMNRLWNGDPEGKVSLLMDWTTCPHDVADPWYTGDFDLAFNNIDAGCLALTEHLLRCARR